MDIYCPICDEPWEIDTLHDVAAEIGTTYETIARTFRTRGCGYAFEGSTYGHTYCQTLYDDTPRQNKTAAMIYDVMGDDLDGAAAMFDEADALGIL